MWLVLTEQQARIKGLEERQIALTEWVHSADTRVTDVERVAAGAQQSISVLLERTDGIAAIGSNIATERERVDVLVGRVNGMVPIEGDVAALRRRVNAIDGRIDDVAQWQDAVEVSLNSVRSRDTANSALSDGVAQWQNGVSPYVASGQPQGTANYESRLNAIERWTDDVVRWQNQVTAWSDGVAQWQNGVDAYIASGQPQGTADYARILLDFIRAYNGDPIAMARLPQHLLTLSDLLN